MLTVYVVRFYSDRHASMLRVERSCKSDVEEHTKVGWHSIMSTVLSLSCLTKMIFRIGSLSLKGASASSELRFAAIAKGHEATSVKSKRTSRILYNSGADDNLSRYHVLHFPVKPSTPQPTTLSMQTVLGLIEFLGDQVVDARDAYEEFAEDTTVLHRMNMMGLTKALEQLW